MRHSPSLPIGRRAFTRGVLPLIAWCLFVVPAAAQRGPLHHFHSGEMAPGAIGRGQLLRGGPLPGYFQPVEVRAPDGAMLAVAAQGQYCEPQRTSVLAGMLIGQVYRMRITGIPGHPGAEIYPTIEVVNRLHPPPGQETRFPIPVHLTAEEIDLALSGRYVMRVVYLEDPLNPAPVRDTADTQRYFEARPDQDLLQAADELGRPMAILRMGSRIPDTQGDPTQLGFAYGMPPVVLFPKPIAVPRNAGLEPPIETSSAKPKVAP